MSYDKIHNKVYLWRQTEQNVGSRTSFEMELEETKSTQRIPPDQN